MKIESEIEQIFMNMDLIISLLLLVTGQTFNHKMFALFQTSEEYSAQ